MNSTPGSVPGAGSSWRATSACPGSRSFQMPSALPSKMLPLLTPGPTSWAWKSTFPSSSICGVEVFTDSREAAELHETTPGASPAPDRRSRRRAGSRGWRRRRRPRRSASAKTAARRNGRERTSESTSRTWDPRIDVRSHTQSSPVQGPVRRCQADINTTVLNGVRGRCRPRGAARALWAPWPTGEGSDHGPALSCARLAAVCVLWSGLRPRRPSPDGSRCPMRPWRDSGTTTSSSWTPWRGRS